MIDSQNSPESETLRVITLMVVRRGVGDKKRTTPDEAAESQPEDGSGFQASETTP